MTEAGFGVEFQISEETAAVRDLRAVLTALGDILADNGTGLIITLDEVQSGELNEIREFGAVLQHVTRREGRPVAFVGAALPQIEDGLLSDNAVTFLQRCPRYDVDRLSREATRLALAGPIEQRGATIDPDALDSAIAATAGYAFMIQLVGFHTWKAVPDPASGISPAEAEEGIAEARRRIGRLVLAPTCRGLSEVDRRFLLAMARDTGESRLARRNPARREHQIRRRLPPPPHQRRHDRADGQEQDRLRTRAPENGCARTRPSRRHVFPATNRPNRDGPFGRQCVAASGSLRNVASTTFQPCSVHIRGLMSSSRRSGSAAAA